MNFKDLTNKKFGRLRVLYLKRERNTRGNLLWECKCDCGNFHPSIGASLVNGDTQSCGCLHKERVSAAQLKHGQTVGGITPEYQAFLDAKRRCTNTKCKDYPDYGGRGIRVLFTSFEQFFAELGPKPRGYSLDRRNNDGNYEPGNVRWATNKTQQNNRRQYRCR
jgi:hypothetical protein